MVEILLATYNGEKYIRQQLDSILNQTYKDFKILIRDDGSTDKTKDIIGEYQVNFPDKIKIIKDDLKCGSSASNFMRLMEESNADYVMFSDQDDFWLPFKIEKSLENIKYIEEKIGSDKPILAYGNYVITDSNLRELEHNDKKNQIYKHYNDLNHLLVQNYVTGCLMIINRALCQKAGKFDTKILMHDHWLALVGSIYGEVYHFNIDVMYYRQHSNNVVGAVNVKSFKYRISKFFDKKTKKSLFSYKNQAELLLNRYNDIPNDKRKVLCTFVELFSKKSKFRKIYILKKYGFLKSDFVRRLGEYWFI